MCVILSLIDTAFDASWAYDWLVSLIRKSEEVVLADIDVHT